MAAAEILAVAATEANSSDVTVASGDQLTVGLKDAKGPGVPADSLVYVQLKDDAGQYFTVDRLTQAKPALVLSAGTWRFNRPGGPTVGVFSA